MKPEQSWNEPSAAERIRLATERLIAYSFSHKTDGANHCVSHALHEVRRWLDNLISELPIKPAVSHVRGENWSL